MKATLIGLLTLTMAQISFASKNFDYEADVSAELHYSSDDTKGSKTESFSGVFRWSKNEEACQLAPRGGSQDQVIDCILELDNLLGNRVLAIPAKQFVDLIASQSDEKNRASAQTLAVLNAKLADNPNFIFRYRVFDPNNEDNVIELKESNNNPYEKVTITQRVGHPEELNTATEAELIAEEDDLEKRKNKGSKEIYEYEDPNS